MPKTLSDPPSASSIRPIRKLLVANRSEIAIRIFRAATELGLRTVADLRAGRSLLACTASRRTKPIRSAKAKGPVGAYLDIEGIVALAKEKGVDAIHPGYGFLSENAALRAGLRARRASLSSGRGRNCSS